MGLACSSPGHPGLPAGATRGAARRACTPWAELVNKALTAKKMARVRMSVGREQPYGDAAWVAKVAGELEHTLRSEGRPPKEYGGRSEN